jgi:hypothetical protein
MNEESEERGMDEMDEVDDEGHELREIVLVVQGRRIRVDRSSLAIISKFFRALFSHQFEDSNKAVLHLDLGGEMGLTVAAVKILANFATTRHLALSSLTAVQLFIAADALDVEIARESAEIFLGSNMLKPKKETFINFWRMSRLFHMKILETFLDGLCLENFGWFCTALPLLSPQYLAAWPLDKLGSFLKNQKFANCSEEQIFTAVVTYCRTRSDKESWDELAPGLYRSCGAYLRYLQSVPRMLPYKITRQ